MFENLNFSKSLSEDLFESWMEKGRESAIGYNYLIVMWNAYEEEYNPVYIEDREGLQKYSHQDVLTISETIVAMYDLFSGTRIG